MKQDLLKIINKYGIDHQLKYIHSEYYELDEAIISAEWTRNIGVLRNPSEISVKHIAEEISDVMVMLKQFQYYYGIEDKEIEDIMQFKIQRQLERIKEEK